MQDDDYTTNQNERNKKSYIPWYLQNKIKEMRNPISQELYHRQHVYILGSVPVAWNLPSMLCTPDQYPGNIIQMLLPANIINIDGGILHEPNTLSLLNFIASNDCLLCTLLEVILNFKTKSNRRIVDFHIVKN